MHGIAVRVIKEIQELEAIAPAWGEVFARSETRSPFMTHNFVRHWWQCFGARQDLHILLAEDAEGPCAIAPLAKASRTIGPLAYRSLELIGTGALWNAGTGLADRSDLLLARRSQESIEAIIGAIHRLPDWDVLNLRGIPEDSTTAHMLDHATLADGHISRQRRWRSPYLPLPSDFEAYLAARGKNFRKNLRRKRQQLEAQGPVTFELHTASRDPALGLQLASDVCRRSWKGAAGTGLLVHESNRRFMHALLSDPHVDAFVAVLFVGETAIAYELGFHLDKKVWSYDSAYDRCWAHSSPGVILTAHIIEEACRCGMVEYDFMRGDEPYKLAWNDASRQEMEYVLDAGTARGRFAREVAFRARWRLRQNATLVEAKTRATGMFTHLSQRIRRAP